MVVERLEAAADVRAALDHAPEVLGAQDYGLSQVLKSPRHSPGIAATGYDTAWLASVPSVHDPRKPRFPLAQIWLRSQQRSDGSWGGMVGYEHDRILTTLAVLPVFAAFPRSPQDLKRVERGTRYLWQHESLLASEPTELVAFELLLPTLVKRANDYGIAVPPRLDIYRRQREEKLKLIPSAALYSGNTTVAHSLEFLGDSVDVSSLRSAQSTNGSIGNSPAATANFLSLTGDSAAEAYLVEAAARHGNEAVPVLYPCESFELTWAAYQLRLAGIPGSSLLTPAQVKHFRAAIANGGVSLSPSFPVPDADETSVVLVLLHDLAGPLDPTLLDAFLTPSGHFASFPFERHSSVGVNIHVLHALLRVPGYPSAQRRALQIIEYLADMQHNALYWHDKWHISPYYATSHALAVFAELPEDLARRIGAHMERARQWMRHTQNDDGSWGFYGQPTLEETAYGVLGLAAAYPNISEADMRRCAAGVWNLRRRMEAAGGLYEAMLPPLWIDKCLYTPTLVARAAVHAAMAKARAMGIPVPGKELL